MATSLMEMLAAANAVVPRISPEQANDMIAKGNVLVVDVRDAPELEASGKVKGALHVSRGMLEFRADLDTPYHDKAFSRDKTIILYCASGGRSALGGKVLKDMGYAEGFWGHCGRRIRAPSPPSPPRALDLAAALDPILEGPEVVDLRIAHVLQDLAAQGGTPP